MGSSADLRKVATELLEQKDLNFVSCTPIQSLWAGYGHICHVEASSTTPRSPKAKPQSLILKYVHPPSQAKTSKSSTPDEGHIRKVLSYQVEQYFYTHLAPLMPTSIGVASCLSSINSSRDSTSVTAMIMSNLREAYPMAGERRGELSDAQTHAALRWLAEFHGFWWTKADEMRETNLVLPPLEHYTRRGNALLSGKGGIWLNGGYTYLATRRKEYAGLLEDSDSEWSSALCEPIRTGKPSIAESVARFLSPAPEPTKFMSSRQQDLLPSSQPYRTLLHGDVKSENLFTTADGTSVAFYDFQYVGLGLGVSDLAKYFTCSVPLRLLLDDTDDVYQQSKLPMQPGEEALLQEYLSQLRKISGREYEWGVFVRHWETALVDWLRFQASWGFWGNSEWLEGRARSILADEKWIRWLEGTTDG